MATTYLSPGVYVETVERTGGPIESVGTSTTAFIGFTAEASRKRVNRRTGNVQILESRLNKPTLVTNWTQYVATFGDFVEGAMLPDAVYNFFTNGGGMAYIVSLRALNEPSDDETAQSATATIPSEKGDAFTVTAKQKGTVGNNLTLTITEDGDDKEKSFSIEVGGQKVSGLTMKKSGGNYVGSAKFDTISVDNIGSNTQHPTPGSYVLSGGGLAPLSAKDFIGSPATREGIGGLEAHDDIRLIVCPDLFNEYDGSEAARSHIRNVQTAIIAHCELMRYRFAILDTPPGLNVEEAREWRSYTNFNSSYAAMYYPWLEVPDLVNGGTKIVPPSGHIAGIYSRTDAERGVHKSPANEAVRGAVGVEFEISRREQDFLNPNGVNCIRPFTNRGLLVWGARTLSGDGAWRYVAVRRLFIFVAASLDEGLQWVVFEPHDATLWSRVETAVRVFLSSLWTAGSLYGSTPEEAFFIKVDAELNPPEVRDLGQLIVEVGISPVKPAEFIIFRLSQWAGVATETEGADAEAAPVETAA